MTLLRTPAQQAAMAIWRETLKRVRADVLLRLSCWREDGRLTLAGSPYDLLRYRRILVLGAGKASSAMARALDEITGDFPTEGLVVTKYQHGISAGRIEVIEAGHPIPDARSVRAGERVLQLASTATEDDLVIFLLSGGASALVEMPVGRIDLRDLQLITESMLKSGADIFELNAVRACLSQIKAGGIARACGSATLVCLVLSDVIGNERAVVGSGPCWGAPPSGLEALRILRARQVPVQEDVEDALRNVPNLPSVHPEHIILGDAYTLLEEAQKAAEGLGMRPKVYGRTFSGEAREVGANMAAEALGLRADTHGYDCMIAAGETTVTVRGDGLGGRNQEVACAAALALSDIPDVAVLAAGTDGTDGPTGAAGALIDGSTHKRADLRRALDENDCFPALEAAEALVVTGPTQTNLNDLVIVTHIAQD